MLLFAGDIVLCFSFWGGQHNPDAKNNFRKCSWIHFMKSCLDMFNLNHVYKSKWFGSIYINIYIYIIIYISYLEKSIWGTHWCLSWKSTKPFAKQTPTYNCNGWFLFYHYGSRYRPKKGISPTILREKGCFDHQSYSLVTSSPNMFVTIFVLPSSEVSCVYLLYYFGESFGHLFRVGHALHDALVLFADLVWKLRVLHGSGV